MRCHTCPPAGEHAVENSKRLNRWLKLPALFWLFLAIAFFQPVKVEAQTVGIDSASSNGAFDGTTGVTSLMWSHTVGSGASRMLIVGVSTSTTMLPPVPPTARVGSVTYGGAPLTRVL